MISEPHAGWRPVEVTARRTGAGSAAGVRALGSLSPHKLPALYEAFPPERARRIAAKLEIHHTPKHGSWLNMAEIELSVLSRQCLDRRIESAEDLRREVSAGQGATNSRSPRLAQLDREWEADGEASSSGGTPRGDRAPGSAPRIAR